ncbi:hypothetical protein [Mycolicibacterium austroafricanum]|uniref:hypothetical protein n=1 Tax=Mycolicibacterium austroafricanum TaxID=39687 RepID=UPI001CA30930|nr:hypothetical protein [Mycolicibacterium austroafricanum]QZT61287.1 hypothetical protein JN085_20175 [Mycolicibacterium austroafricanum]
MSYLVEDVVSVARWAVGEVVAELDYRLQPAHVRQGWAAELADIEAGIDVHEPYAPYLQWGGPETWPNSPYCNRCGYPHPTTLKCLRDESSAVPPTAERPSEVSAAPPSQTPSEGHPIVELIAEVLAEHVPESTEVGHVKCFNPFAIETLHAHCNDMAAWREHVSVNIANRILLRAEPS